MEKIQILAVFPNIAPGDLAEFKQLAAETLQITLSEPGTLQYDWFLSEDQTRCVLSEIYADSDAMLAHLANVGEYMGRQIELGGGLEGDVYGSPSAELAEAIAPFNPTVYGHFQGK
jgi:quinol monooxygenase YgiN